MTRPRNYRVFSLLGILLAAALILLLFEHRPSFLRPGLRLSAYITTSDGSLTVVDLVKLRATAHIPIGQKLSGVREHPTRPEIKPPQKSRSAPYPTRSTFPPTALALT